MAERAIFRIPRLGPTAEERKRAAQHLRRDLRIAIRQLERAELYLVALYSLDLGDIGVDQCLDGLVRDIRGLRQALIQTRLRQPTALE